MELACIAAEVKAQGENIGARRLHTVLERTVEEISFEADTIDVQTFEITPNYICK